MNTAVIILLVLIFIFVIVPLVFTFAIGGMFFSGVSKLAEAGADALNCSTEKQEKGCVTKKDHGVYKTLDEKVCGNVDCHVLESCNEGYTKNENEGFCYKQGQL